MRKNTGKSLEALPEVATIMPRVLAPEPGMELYDPCTASGAFLVKCEAYNTFPSRYIHTSDAEIYQPIAEIVEELSAIELEAKETDEALRNILRHLGVGV